MSGGSAGKQEEKSHEVTASWNRKKTLFVNLSKQPEDKLKGDTRKPRVRPTL